MNPHDLLSVSGYTAWRVGGTLAIFAAVFGLLAAVRALRTEEDAGRMELVLAGIVGRRTSYLAAIAAIAAGVVLLWAGGVRRLSDRRTPRRRIGLPGARDRLGGRGVRRRRRARQPARADRPPRARARRRGPRADVPAARDRRHRGGAGWLRWPTPLGWAEELRPFAGAQPLVLVLPAAATVLLLGLARGSRAGGDIGTGTLPSRDSAAPRLGLLSSPTAQALRSERTSLLVWASGVGVFALILGVVSKSVSSAGIAPNVRRELAKLGSGSIVTPTGYLAFVFIFFILTVSLFACAQIGAARHEEADGRLETLLALPVAGPAGSPGAWRSLPLASV